MSVRTQPWLGIATTALAIVLALLFIAPLSAATFGGWVAFTMMCAIPFAIVVGAYWHGEHPAPIAKLGQPVRGLAYLALTAVVAALVAFVLWVTIGGSVGPPVPMLAQATILSVVVAFFMSIVWGGWPFSLIRNRLVSGLVLLVAGYVVAALLFEVFFDYAWLKGAPVYVAALDPTGLFDAWDATVVAVTALAVMFLTLHLDLWPLTRSAGLMKQPVLGLVWTALCLVVGVVLYYLGTRTFGMTPPRLPRHRAGAVHLRVGGAAQHAAALGVRRADAAGQGRAQRGDRDGGGHGAGAALPGGDADGDG